MPERYSTWPVHTYNLRPVDSEVRLAQLGHLRGVATSVFRHHWTDRGNPIWIARFAERPFGQNNCAAFRWLDVEHQVFQYRSGVSHWMIWLGMSLSLWPSATAPI